MSTTTIHLRVAVKKSNRHPYQKVRLLGSRAAAQHGEVVVPLALRIDDAWFSRELNRALVEVQAPADQPTATLNGTPA